MKAKWLVVLGSRISSSLQNLKVMNESRTLLVLTLVFVFASRGNGIQIKSSQDFYVLVMIALSYYYYYRSSLLRNGIAV